MGEKAKWEGLYQIRHYVVGSMTLLKLSGKDVKTGRTPIYLEQLNGEKLRFVSRVLLPKDKEILLGLRFSITENLMEFKAHIVGVISNEKKKQYTYLVEFDIDNEEKRVNILSFVNKIQLANKQKKLRNVTQIAIEIE